MNLYVLRHGIAADKPEWKGPDSHRPLTKEGIRKMKKGAKGIRRLGILLDRIITSPYRRAYDTAKIVAKELKLRKQLKVSKMLVPNGDPKALVRHLGLSYRSWESVLLVGHDPYLSQFMSVLTCGTPQIGMELDKGGLAKLTADSFTFGQCAHLEWLLTYKILRKLA